MCFLTLLLVTFNEFRFHKPIQPPIGGISYSQPHILQKVSSGIYCPLCQEQTLFVSLELGLNLLIYLRDCMWRGCVGVKPILTSQCHRLCNIKSNLSQPSFPDCRVLVYVVISYGSCITSLITVFLWFFSSFFTSTTSFLTGTRTALVFKTWAKPGYRERHNTSLLFSAPFPKQP